DMSNGAFDSPYAAFDMSSGAFDIPYGAFDIPKAAFEGRLGSGAIPNGESGNHRVKMPAGDVGVGGEHGTPATTGKPGRIHHSSASNKLSRRRRHRAGALPILTPRLILPNHGEKGADRAIILADPDHLLRVLNTMAYWLNLFTGRTWEEFKKAGSNI